MFTAILASMLLFILSIALLQAALVKRRFTAKRQRGLLMIQQLFQLLEMIPQHRGMTNALLQGNHTFKEKCLQLQQKIAQQLQQIHQQYPELANSPCYIEITNDWNKISQNFSSLTAPSSFNQHTVIIANLLELIGDVGSQCKLNSSQNQKLQELMGIGIDTLPAVTEALGQARGIGTGVATQAKLTPQSRSKLSYLHKKAATICNDTSTILFSLQTDNKALNFSQCQRSINLFLNTLNRELLMADPIQIEPDHYFAIASDAVSHSFEQLNRLMGEINNTLDEEHAAQQRKVRLCLFFILLAMSLVAGVLYTI